METYPLPWKLQNTVSDPSRLKAMQDPHREQHSVLGAALANGCPGKKRKDLMAKEGGAAQVHTHTHTHIHAPARTHARTHTYTRVHMQVHAHTSTHTHTHTHTHVYMYIIHTHTHAHTHTHRPSQSTHTHPRPRTPKPALAQARAHACRCVGTMWAPACCLPQVTIVWPSHPIPSFLLPTASSHHLHASFHQHAKKRKT